MRTGLIIFGVIFLVIGGLLYFVPIQELRADTTTAGAGNVDTRTSSASVTVPIEWAFASGLIGLILFILGLVIPSSKTKIISKKDSHDNVVMDKREKDRSRRDHD